MSNSLPEAKFYNYIYLDPRKPGRYCYEGLNFSLLFEPFYVGKGSSERKLYHLKYQNYSYEKNLFKKNKIKKISEKFDLQNFILQTNNNIPEFCSFAVEIFYIEAIGRLDLESGPLTNRSNGGTGGATGLGPWNKGIRYLEHFGKDYSNPNKGKTKKEICGEGYIHPRQGKRLKDTKDENYSDPRQGKTLEEIYGKGYVDPKKGRIFERVFCIYCKKEISTSKLTYHFNKFHEFS